MEIAKYIISILRTQPTIVMSWGFHNATALRDGLAFEVQGFLFTGTVKVIYDEGSDAFTVVLEKNGEIWTARQGVYFDELVDTIDKSVEHCPDYEQRVKEQYAFTNSKSEIMSESQ